MSAGNAIYPAESADRVKSNTAASPGIRMQFRSPPSRNIVSENPLNVSQFDFKESRVSSSMPVLTFIIIILLIVIIVHLLIFNNNFSCQVIRK